MLQRAWQDMQGRVMWHVPPLPPPFGTSESMRFSGVALGHQHQPGAFCTGTWPTVCCSGTQEMADSEVVMQRLSRRTSIDGGRMGGSECLGLAHTNKGPKRMKRPAPRCHSCLPACLPAWSCACFWRSWLCCRILGLVPECSGQG